MAHLGEEWLARGSADVTFLKPAYEEELLTIHSSQTKIDGGPPAYALTCFNDQETELARMAAGLADTGLAPDPRGEIPPGPALAERPTVTWDLMEIGKPFPSLRWQPTAAENLQWCRDSRDELPLYRDGAAPPLHPGFILRQANFALRRRFIIPAWIHASSHIAFYDALRVGAN